LHCDKQDSHLKLAVFMENFSFVINYFLPPSSQWTVIRHRKASMLIFTHFFILLELIILLMSSKAIASTTFIPVLCALPATLASLYYFKKIGHINVSGNVLTMIWFSIMIPILYQTGGIRSCFIPWLYSVVLIMALIENYKWASIWFFAATVACVAFFVAGRFNSQLNISICTDIDSFVSYLTVGFFIFTNLVVFEKHQVLVIKILKEKNIELKNQKKEIASNVEALEKMQQQLTTTNQELHSFAHVASHDLKEPLRMIKMYTQLLEKRMQSMLDSNAKEYMYYITDGVNRMQKLLDNLLAYSLIGKNADEIKNIDLNKTIVTVLQNLTVLIQEANASIQFEYLPKIAATGTEMVQLFQNIIANALKFRKKEGKSVISINYTENDLDYIFAIADNGIGIKKADQERVFNIFTRLHNRSEFEGTGIGLATCKKILTNANGKIWVTSTEGVGTTFHFSMPKSDLTNLIEENSEQPHKQSSKQFLLKRQLVN
jgi:signal transduction histidine kinase